jgi:DNA-binding CsgD family transcriptional regulator
VGDHDVGLPGSVGGGLEHREVDQSAAALGLLTPPPASTTWPASSRPRASWPPPGPSWSAPRRSRSACSAPTTPTLDGLPRETQRLLAVAAAEPLGDPRLLWLAAELLGIGAEAVAPAEAAGLLRLGVRVGFRHPLGRSTVYRRAMPGDRRRVHRALPEVTDAGMDADRRAWHRAQAASGPDEEVAGDLERSAGRARARGGLAAAAAFLEQAAVLTRGPDRRAGRALAAAQAKLGAGAPEAAREPVATAHTAPLDDLQRAMLERLRGQIAFALRRGSDAPPLLLEGARRLEHLAPELSRDTYLEALFAAIYAGRLGGEDGLRRTAEAARAAPAPPTPPQAIDLLLDGLVTRFTDGYVAAAPVLKLALDAFRRESALTGGDVRALWLAIDLWDDEAWHELASRLVEFARDAGALAVLPLALNSRAGYDLLAGDLVAAAALTEVARGITGGGGQSADRLGGARARLLPRSGRRGAGACRRQPRGCHCPRRGRRDDDSGVRGGRRRKRARAIPGGDHTRALAVTHDEFPWSQLVLSEFVEAAARGGARDAAAAALDRLAERARASGTDWALGIEARSRALLSEGAAAESLYRESIERLGRRRMAVQLARAHLLYGEWRRRERRRLDAREQLRTAHRMLVRMGADGFAERAARELLATGETARRRVVETRSQLTAQEVQIARLARDGRSNPEIGAQLLISPRTVEYHLRKVFTKLDISSRSQLDRAPLG